MKARKKTQILQEPKAATRLAQIIEEHLANLSPAEQDKRITAARAALARARAARRATPSARRPNGGTPLAARGRG